VKRRFSAMRALILMAQSESGFDYHGPATEKLNIGPTKREFKYKREQVFTGISSTTDSVKTVTTERISTSLRLRYRPVSAPPFPVGAQKSVRTS
jgi:hypothetical protein